VSTTPPKPKVSKANHPLAINEPIMDEDDMLAAFDRIRAALVDGDRNLSSSAGYIQGLLNRYDMREFGSWGRRGRVNKIYIPLAAASELLMDAAGQVKRAGVAFTRIYVNQSPAWEDEFKVKGKRGR
jgi:hypothetical protein